MNARLNAIAALVIAIGVARAASDPAPGGAPEHVGLEDSQLVERSVVVVRLDPRSGARPGECDTLAPGDVVATAGDVRLTVRSVERVPRPERHWLLLDISGSAEGRRREAMRSAREYIRRVVKPELDSAAVLTVDDDVILVGGPSSDPRALDESVAGVPAGGGSALRDGLETVLRQVEGDRHEHLILYWTDGQDTQSVTTNDELLETLARTPNATIFPLALMPTSGPRAGDHPIGAFLFDVAKRSRGEVFASTDPRWVDRVRGWIARRFTVVLAPPEGAGGGRLRITVPGRRCETTILADPFARADAIAGSAPPAPRSWVRVHAKQRRHDDPPCAADPTASPWDRPLRSAGDRLAGCVLDAVEAVGPVVRGAGKSLRIGVTDARIAARDVRVLAPRLGDLPHELVDAIPSMLAQPGADPDARSPVIIEGGALLAQRTRVAASLFAARTDYRDFALARLARLSDDDLRVIAKDFAHAFPDLDNEEIAGITRASRAGRRAIEAGRTPTDTDLARVLAAWLGDLPAYELFRAWEKRLVDARLAGHGDPDAVTHWTALRRRFGQPENLRVAAPLVLIHDQSRDLVGFWRVVLPRPTGYDERATNSKAAKERVEDRIPDRPKALDVLEDALRRKDVRERLAGAPYRATRIEYLPLDPVWKAPREDPYRHARVTITLDAPGRSRMVLGE